VNVRTALENILGWYKKNRELIASVRPIEPSFLKVGSNELGRTA